MHETGLGAIDSVEVGFPILEAAELFLIVPVAANEILGEGALYKLEGPDTEYPVLADCAVSPDLHADKMSAHEKRNAKQ